MKLEKPVIIVGTGRSGSTVFHDILSYHENLAWFSKWVTQYPEKPCMNRFLMHCMSNGVIAPILRRRVKATECYDFWELHCKGFSRPYRDLRAEDVTETHRKVRDLLPPMLTRRRNRMMIKVTGWPRIGFLKEIFPDARFIHIYRDGRSVSSSNMLVPFWDGYRGPAQWRWGELNDQQRQEWEKHDRSFVALAGLQWKILMRSFREAGNKLDPDDYLELSYEAMCAEPERTFRKTIDFCGLEWTDSFAGKVRSVKLLNTNDKWKSEFTPEQKAVLEEVLAPALAEWGYPLSNETAAERS